MAVLAQQRRNFADHVSLSCFSISYFRLSSSYQHDDDDDNENYDEDHGGDGGGSGGASYNEDDKYASTIYKLNNDDENIWRF